MVKDKETSHDSVNSDCVKAKTSVNGKKNVLPMLAHDINDFNILRTEDILTSDVDFKSLLLPDFILKGLTTANFLRPSPIQLRSIPLLRLGFDLIVQSKAGTGKTLVIALAALESVKQESKRLQAIVIAPTHEIALQTKHFISTISSDVAVRTEAFIGGTSVKEDKKNTLGCQIAIGTPGRLNSLIDSGDLSVNNVRLFVLDEADKLMEKSIFSQIRSISKSLPNNKQTILCSATFLHPVKDYVVKHMKEPFWVTPEKANRLQPNSIEHQKSTSTILIGVKQFCKEVPNHAQIIRKLKFKLEEILEILAGHSFTQCIIFSNYQTRAETICHQLVSNGWPAMSIRGQDDQSHRTATLNSFKELQSRVLLTTDVMSRGVDFKGVDLVINLDIPYDSATYLHRMGRAGRFGSYGCVITLASSGEEVESFKKILSEIDGSVVYNLPSDLSLIKQGQNLDSLFFGLSEKLTCVHVNSQDFVKEDGKVEDKGLELDGANQVYKDLQNECSVNEKDDTQNNNSIIEPAKFIGADDVSDAELNSDVRTDHVAESEVMITVGLKESLPDSVSSLHDTTVPNSSRISFNSKQPHEMAVQRATAEVSKALCTSKRRFLTFHSFDDLENMFSSWTLDDKKCLSKPPLSEKKLKFEDWWAPANIVLNAANLQLQELKENALKPPELSKDIECEISAFSSEDSYYQPKKWINGKGKKKSDRRKNKSTSHAQYVSNSHQKDNITAAPEDNTPWLWDESSHLYYIWDEHCSCYYLYNPELKHAFKWEPSMNRYYKWDKVSQNYKLWDCESGSYCKVDASLHSVNQPKLPRKNSHDSCSRNMVDHDYIGWFSMWNRQIRQMSTQVYQAEYFQNMLAKFPNS